MSSLNSPELIVNWRFRAPLTCTCVLSSCAMILTTSGLSAVLDGVLLTEIHINRLVRLAAYKTIKWWEITAAIMIAWCFITIYQWVCHESGWMTLVLIASRLGSCWWRSQHHHTIYWSISLPGARRPSEASPGGPPIKTNRMRPGRTG